VFAHRFTSESSPRDKNICIIISEANATFAFQSPTGIIEEFFEEMDDREEFKAVHVSKVSDLKCLLLK